MSLRLLDLDQPFPTRGDEPWQRDAIKRFCQVYPNLRRPHPAARLVRQKPRIVDYFEQAPCLIAIGYAPVCIDAMKTEQPLRTVLTLAGGAKSLRKLRGRSVLDVRPHVLRGLATLNPSLVAQAIPDGFDDQVSFLAACAHVFPKEEEGFSQLLLAPKTRDWWVSRFAPQARAYCLTGPGVLDYIVRSGRPFDCRWSYEEAQKAVDRWHTELATMNAEERFFKQHGLAFDQEIDYGDFPLRYVVDGYEAYEFIALRSGAALFEEGRAMHHCVGSYSADVVAGTSRIYSVRKDGARVVTMEMRRATVIAKGHSTSPPFLWRIEQVCGPCNAPPDHQVAKACIAFGENVVRASMRPRRDLAA